ncbi:MAG: DUF3800 domain-containing protein [Elusimicrobiales bacterium]|nr:DUF3800 domain-containing protein [Elusimicrobiales bacterium]
MLYLYLDESGDLGFDFVSGTPSLFFTVAVLAIKGEERNRALHNAVRMTIRRKLRGLHGNGNAELKGSRDSLEMKKYFYQYARGVEFKVYAMTLDKRKAILHLLADKERIYNYLARLVLERLSFSDTCVRVILTVDKSKTKREIERFNNYVVAQIKSRLDPKVPLEIYHRTSHQVMQLQAADMFAWGIFRKYERGDTEWLELFREKVGFESVCLK